MTRSPHVTIYDVIGLGIPFTDVIIPVPDAVRADVSALRSTDAATKQAVCTHLAHHYAHTTHAGGPIVNTLAGLAALDRTKRYGHIGMMGQDAYGARIRDNISCRGIDHLSPIHEHAPSPVVYAFVTPDGERHMVALPSQALQLKAEKLPLDALTACRVFYTPASFIEDAQLWDVLLPVLNQRRVQGQHNVFNLHALRHLSPVMRSALNDGATVIIGNEEEWTLCHNMPSVTAIKTCDADGMRITHQGHEHHITTIPVTNIVNTLGAGDQLAAGVLYGVLHDQPIHDAVRTGMRCASAILHQSSGHPAHDTDWSHFTKDLP